MSTSNIFSLPSDVLREIALRGQLKAGEILNLCESHPTFNATVCQNEEFWLALGKIYLTEDVSILNKIDIQRVFYEYYSKSTKKSSSDRADVAAESGYEKALALELMIPNNGINLDDVAGKGAGDGYYRIIDVCVKHGLNLNEQLEDIGAGEFSIIEDYLLRATSFDNIEVIKWLLRQRDILSDPETYLKILNEMELSSIPSFKFITDKYDISKIAMQPEWMERLVLIYSDASELKVLLDSGIPARGAQDSSPEKTARMNTILDKFAIAPASIHYSITALKILSYKYLTTLSIDQLCSLIASDYQKLITLAKPCIEYSVNDLLRVLLDRLTELELTELVNRGGFPPLLEQYRDSNGLELIPNRISDSIIADIYAQVESHHDEVNMAVDGKLYKPILRVAEKLQQGLGWRNMFVTSLTAGSGVTELKSTDHGKMRVVMGLRDYIDIIIRSENDVKLLRVKVGSLLKLPPSWIIDAVKENYGRVVVFSENPIFRPE